jgi:tetratricopeptide (TPR) repeat protein
LLGGGERRLFRRLAVFAGGCTLATAEALCGGTPDLEPLGLDVLDGADSLVDKNLLQAQEGPGGEPRLAMLQTIREYAAERLAESGEEAALRRAHAAHFLALAQEAEAQLSGAQAMAWAAVPAPPTGPATVVLPVLDRLDADHENLRAALAWSRADAATAETGARLAGALVRFWYLRGPVGEGRAWLEEALARTDPAAQPALRAQLLQGAGALAQTHGDYGAARTRLQESLALSRAAGDERAAGSALLYLGTVAVLENDPAGARPLLEEALALARAAGDREAEAFASRWLGDALRDAGDPAAAGAAYEASLALFRALGDTWGVAMLLNALGTLAWAGGDLAAARDLHEQSLTQLRPAGSGSMLAVVLVTLGTTALQQGDYGPAQAHLAEGLRTWWELGHRTGATMGLAGLARLAAARGQAERAGRLFGAAAAHFPPSGRLLDGTVREAFDRHGAAARSDLDPAAFAAGWAAGQAMSLEQAVAYALEGHADAG